MELLFKIVVIPFFWVSVVNVCRMGTNRGDKFVEISDIFDKADNQRFYTGRTSTIHVLPKRECRINPIISQGSALSPVSGNLLVTYCISPEIGAEKYAVYRNLLFR